MIHDTSRIMPEPIPPHLLGSASLTPQGSFEAGSMQGFELVYTAGFYGIDDSGTIRIVGRFASDQSQPQLDDPTGWNYTTVEASNGAVLRIRFDTKGNVRPWDRTLEIRVVRGYLSEGDTITVRFGDRREGSPGMRLQTFCEDTFEFRVLVDPIATFVFQPLPEQPTIRIVPGPPHQWRLVLPTLRRPDEPFRLSIKADDIWGNPSDQVDATLSLAANMPVRGLPETVRFPAGQRSLVVDRLQCDRPGDLVIDARDGARHLARSNPLRIDDTAETPTFWGDLHGQSEETIGTNSAQDYFLFGRDLAFLDACAHQGNDFQMSGQFWNDLNRITAELNQPGRFVTVPGFEWSGNTALGGDRNVFYFHEGRPIRRSSHAMLPDGSDIDTDTKTAGDLFEVLTKANEDAVCFAHCGGRYADIRLFHDGRFERSVEVHSAWGTFEWLLHDAFEMGYRVGIVCNSDGHKGRPGASYAGAASFGAIGGLTCYIMPELTREALFECLRRRRHYGTTGSRLHLDVRMRFAGEVTVFNDDPDIMATFGTPASEVRMGDIVDAGANPAAELDVSVLAAAPVERVDIFDGKRLLATRRPFDAAALGRRIRVIWEGAEYRGRARQVIWDGDALVEGNRIESASAINFFNRDKTLDIEGDDRLRWRHLTTGNFGGFDLVLAGRDGGTLHLNTPLVKESIEIASITMEDRVFDASGVLPRRVRVFRLPDENNAFSVRFTQAIEAGGEGDHPIYVRVTTEDGHQAWSSPIYLI